MAPGFVTQLVVDEPQVIAIADQLDLSFLRKNLHGHSLSVQAITPTEVLATGFTWPDTAYKIVWFCEVGSIEINQAERITKVLSIARVPVVVVVVGATALKNAHPMFRAWHVFSGKQSALCEMLFRLLPSVPLLFAQDVILPHHSLLPVVAAMTQSLSTGTLIDPQVTLFPQAWDAFSQSLAKLLIKPGLHSTTIRGKKVSTSTLAKLVQLYSQRATGVLPSVEIVAVQTAELTEFPVVDNFASYSLDELASEVVENTPVISHKPTEVSPLSEPKKYLINQSLNSIKQQPKPTFDRESTVTKITSASVPPPVVTRPPTLVIEQSEPQKASAKSTTDLDAEMNRLFQSYRSEHKVKRVRTIAKNSVKTTKKNKQRSWLFKGGVGIVCLALLLLLVTAEYFTSSWLLKKSVAQAMSNGGSFSRTAMTLASVVAAQNNIFNLVFDPTLLSQNMYLVDIATSGNALTEQKKRLTELSQVAYLQVVGRQTGRVFETTSQAALTAQSLYQLIAENQAWIKEIDFSPDPQTQAQIQTYTDSLSQEKKSLLPIQQLQPLLPQLLGAEGRRTYVVLFQNPQELRPTGGFIQSVALVTFEDGVVINSQVMSAYELDTSVPGVVQPPTDLEQLLGEKQWFFRDSNWQPDFPTTATQATWFVEKGLDTTVDGVIGLNAYVVRDLLRVLGPVELPEYNEVITDRNLFERLEFHSELQLVDPDKDYSTLLFSRVLQKMSNVTQDKGPAILEVLRQNFDAKQLTMSLKNESESLTLTTLGWSGALLQPDCPVQLDSPVCVVDTVAQVESNVGVNKANAYVEREITHDVSLEADRAIHMRTMTFNNTATSNAWPKGTYKNYLRLYVSPDAELASVTINGVPLSASQVVTRTESNKKVFGFLVETPVQQSSQVEVVYSVAHAFPNEYTYAVFNQQQPGIITPPLHISIQYPPQVQPAIIAPQAVVENDTIRFNQLTLPHTFVGVVFK